MIKLLVAQFYEILDICLPRMPSAVFRSVGKEDMRRILVAMSNIQDNTCVQFRRKTEEDVDYIQLVPGIAESDTQIDHITFPGHLCLG